MWTCMRIFLGPVMLVGVLSGCAWLWAVLLKEAIFRRSACCWIREHPLKKNQDTTVKSHSCMPPEEARWLLFGFC